MRSANLSSKVKPWYDSFFALLRCTLSKIPTGTNPGKAARCQNPLAQRKTRLNHQPADPTHKHRERRRIQNHEKRQAHNQTLVLRLANRKGQLESQEAQAAVQEAGRRPRIPRQRPAGRWGWRDGRRSRVGQREDPAQESEVEARGDEAEGEAGEGGEGAVWEEYGTDGCGDGSGSDYGIYQA